MTLKTPVLNTKGLYSLATPFDDVLAANVAYTSVAIRSFRELIASGVDVFATVYDPVGLTEETYTADLATGASIVTLMADNQPVVQVPDTYIQAFPRVGNVPYSTVILGVSLGPLPDGLDLTFVQQQVTNVVAAVIGATPSIMVLTAPNPTVLTQEQANTAETARQAAITLRVSDYTVAKDWEAKFNALQAQYAELEAYVIANQAPPST